jgi:arylsulfatase A-like enzyme
MLYAEKCTMVDRWIGYFLDNVKRLGLEEDTLIIFVADHGEPMGNGEHGHGIMRKSRPWPYEELVHIPIIMKGPGLPAGKRVTAFVDSPDVAPTVTDWLGLGVPSHMQGVSLLPLARGEVDKVRDFSIAGYHRFSWSIITEDWSYIHWLREEDKTTWEWVQKMFLADMQKGMGEVMGPAEGASMGEANQLLKDAATLDGEDQWTCTPGSVAELPERDELYDRKADPFQLKNVIDKHPEKAKELFQQLREYMAELRAT